MARRVAHHLIEHPDHLERPARKGKRNRALPKQSQRQQTADQVQHERVDASLKKLLPTRPLTESQADHLNSLRSFRLSLAEGPAGTGKTYCPIATALDLLVAGDIERLVCLRPTVEAGGKLGHLPGTLAEKIDPFFAPIRRSIIKKFGSKPFAERWMKTAIDSGSLVFCSIQHLRGETLEHCFVHLDEAQNCSYAELKLVLTRMGEGSRFSFCGDSDQSDLPAGISGWSQLVGRVSPLQDVVAVIRYKDEDCVRDPLLARLLPLL